MFINKRCLLYALLSIPCCLSIKCVRSNSDKPNITNECEGDYCFKMRTSDSSSLVIYTQDCVSGLILEEGCISDSADTRMCICSTDNCNAGGVIDRGVAIRDVKCFTYDIEYEDFRKFNITDADKVTKRGPVCVSEGIKWEDTDTFHFSYSTSRIHAFPIYIHPPHEPQFEIYYHGEMYRLQYIENYSAFFQYCVQDNCNRMDFLSVKPGNVTCVLYTARTENASICHGDFCVYSYGMFHQYDADDVYAEAMVYWQTCLSTNSSASDYAIEVGTYSVYGVTHLICDADNCNKDQLTALSAIELHEKHGRGRSPFFEPSEEDTKEDDSSVHQQIIPNSAILVSFAYFSIPYYCFS